MRGTSWLFGAVVCVSLAGVGGRAEAAGDYDRSPDFRSRSTSNDGLMEAIRRSNAARNQRRTGAFFIAVVIVVVGGVIRLLAATVSGLASMMTPRRPKALPDEELPEWVRQSDDEAAWRSRWRG
jgi:hypothetical protein